MICYAILRGYYLLMEGEYREHYKKIYGKRLCTSVRSI